MKELTFAELNRASGGTFGDGVTRAVDHAARGAFIGGTVGWVAGPSGAALGAAAGAVYGAGIGLMQSIGNSKSN